MNNYLMVGSLYEASLVNFRHQFIMTSTNRDTGTVVEEDNIYANGEGIARKGRL